MSWRHGEVWLDTDVWVDEQPEGETSSGSQLPEIPDFGPPPGLAASRQRRAAWRRRRYARRAQATALALSPAVMFPIVAHGIGGRHPATGAAEDSPSQTYRLGAGVGEAPAPLTAQSRVGAERPRRSVLESARTDRSIAPATLYPKIEWHHATSVGLPYDGSLIDGTQLPIAGPDWVTWDPVTNSVPNAPNRLYGNEHTIQTIVSVAAAYHAANPDASPIVVGDISLEGGGPMRDEHVSHQNGLDADIYYPRLDGALSAPTTSDEIDESLSQDLVDRFVAAGAQMIFVGYSTGLQGPSGVVMPYANHEYHMHVRFPPPSG